MLFFSKHKLGLQDEPSWRSNVTKVSCSVDIRYRKQLQGNSSEGPVGILLH